VRLQRRAAARRGAGRVRGRLRAPAAPAPAGPRAWRAPDAVPQHGAHEPGHERCGRRRPLERVRAGHGVPRGLSRTALDRRAGPIRPRLGEAAHARRPEEERLSDDVTVCVLAPQPQLTITIEERTGSDEPQVHIHTGGQGLWVARMAASLGARATVCGPFGGETGTVAALLAEHENLAVRSAPYSAGNGATIHDNRAGEPVEIAIQPPGTFDRHELDDLYGAFLVEALGSDA